MIYPATGRVLVFDDVQEDVQPLLRALAKNGIPYMHYSDATGADLPSAPIYGVRLVFLDLQLVSQIINDDTVVSSIRARFERTIEPNEPYVLIYWSKKEDRFRETMNAAFTNRLADYKPVVSISLNKPDVLSRGDGTLDYLQEKLEDEVLKCKEFQLLVHWENLVARGASMTTAEFVKAVRVHEDWTQRLAFLIMGLSRAYAGNHCNSPTYTAEDRVRDAFLTLNQSLEDVIERLVLDRAASPDVRQYLGANAVIDPELLRIINTKLLTTELGLNGMKPGAVLLADEHITRGETKLSNDIEYFGRTLAKASEDKKQKMQESQEKRFNQTRAQLQDVRSRFDLQFNRLLGYVLDDTQGQELLDKCIARVIRVDVNVTPVCDYAQGKHPKIRFASGVLLHVDDKPLVRSLTNYLYISDVTFEWRGASYYLVLDMKFMHTWDEDAARERTPIMSLRHQFLIDVQAKLSAHGNRPGLLYMTE